MQTQANAFPVAGHHSWRQEQAGKQTELTEQGLQKTNRELEQPGTHGQELTAEYFRGGIGNKDQPCSHQAHPQLLLP